MFAKVLPSLDPELKTRLDTREILLVSGPIYSTCSQYRGTVSSCQDNAFLTNSSIAGSQGITSYTADTFSQTTRKIHG